MSVYVCIYMLRIIINYPKELAHMIMEAEKSYDLSSGSGGPEN